MSRARNALLRGTGSFPRPRFSGQTSAPLGCPSSPPPLWPPMACPGFKGDSGVCKLQRLLPFGVSPPECELHDASGTSSVLAGPWSPALTPGPQCPGREAGLSARERANRRGAVEWERAAWRVHEAGAAAGPEGKRQEGTPARRRPRSRTPGRPAPAQPPAAPPRPPLGARALGPRRPRPPYPGPEMRRLLHCTNFPPLSPTCNSTAASAPSHPAV